MRMRLALLTVLLTAVKASDFRPPGADLPPGVNLETPYFALPGGRFIHPIIKVRAVGRAPR